MSDVDSPREGEERVPLDTEGNPLYRSMAHGHLIRRGHALVGYLSIVDNKPARIVRTCCTSCEHPNAPEGTLQLPLVRCPDCKAILLNP